MTVPFVKEQTYLSVRCDLTVPFVKEQTYLSVRCDLTVPFVKEQTYLSVRCLLRPSDNLATMSLKVPHVITPF